MDDLSGLSWSGPAKNSNKGSGTGNYYPTIAPTSQSGRNTPLSAHGLGALKPAGVPPKSTTPDSFSNLVSFGAAKTNTLTLQQQQERLQAEKRAKEAEQKKQYDSQFGSPQFWDGLGGSGQQLAPTPPIASQLPSPFNSAFPSPFAKQTGTPASNGPLSEPADDSDLFAAFNKDTKVDNSSHYPPPSIPSSGRGTPAVAINVVPDLSQPQAWEQPASGLAEFGDDDDPFGLGQMKPQSTPAAAVPEDDDDFLGDLAKPVEEIRRPSPALKRSSPGIPLEESESESEQESNDPWDKAVSQLVEMGFSAEHSRRALTESGAGLNVQAAVGWLMNEAHRQAKAKALGQDTGERNGPAAQHRSETSRDGRRPDSSRERERERSKLRREDRPEGADDLSKMAADVGNNIFKTANSFWKSSQKKVQRAVADFSQDSDPSQPKWMREAAEREAADGRTRRAQADSLRNAPEVTDEALMLEGDSRPVQRQARAPLAPDLQQMSRDQSPAISSASGRSTPNPRWQQMPSADPRSRVNKQIVEDQSAQAYVSPARRKKTTPQPTLRQPSPEPDLLFSNSHSGSAPSKPTPRITPNPSKPSTPIPVRPKAPPRTIPNLSSIALQSSNQHRLAGTAHFKRGDYAAAHQSYSSSLDNLPQGHPITIILLCNRALTSLKTGSPREAVQDSEKAISVIGPSRGDNEVIDLCSGDSRDKKEMKEFFGKALMRKAEALEQMERWSDAGAVWKQCVEAGVGGTNSVQGRQRCEKALAPKPTSRPTPRPSPAPTALSSLAPAKDSAAVSRLRAANVAAEKADDEKFALQDKVDARISAWRDGKRDNLRALIGSMENVLWEGSGWKKVGLHELVVNGKVKVAYMKAIGKCHPDKLPQDASQEVRMIAATVFSTLNESWDRFKEQNGL